ncbi:MULTISPECIES: hypothetical protein [unclassified Novosphingobium]|uniref:hypothetical protein n=1 Tax=unclassified Novosphingobium TaxID=2644732 RepID=UPI00086EA093|nr:MULTISPECIES: hypothetical protein [unclassified Novosphingobium]MBN9145375.1 hypothetical protein [Novosphingobium sp.]MDR6709885.1 hypothetical protein [Novosphingobium sp. 1748]ODU83160.1 MAG: hypothetical protein ABT10_08210 [Novosphingobium sp. SCN 63-17]OJX88098.1 MAG: hypothetical protein BGP00_01930 [Novosphingobium sp. 63-713]
MKNGIFTRLAALFFLAFAVAFPSLASAATTPLFDFTDYTYSRNTYNNKTAPTSSTDSLISVAATKTNASKSSIAGVSYTALANGLFNFDYSVVTNSTSAVNYTLHFVVNGVSTALTSSPGTYAYNLSAGDTFGWLLTYTKGSTNSTATLKITNFTTTVAAPEIDGAKLPLALLLMVLLFIAGRYRMKAKDLAA